MNEIDEPAMFPCIQCHRCLCDRPDDRCVECRLQEEQDELDQPLEGDE